MFRHAGWLVGAGVLIASVWKTPSTGADPSAAQTNTGQRFVVAELFTSEGCSSCPPADDELSQLSRPQPISAVEVLALGEHVDYWDGLGWRDRFSSAAFSARQSEYDARVFRTGSIYTPQLVVDGHLQRVGSDRTAVRRAIEEAARSPKSVVGVEARADGGTVRVNLAVDVPEGIVVRDATEMVVAITEDKLATDVRKGENGGHVLKHDGVVRAIQTIGVMPVSQRTWRTSAMIPLEQGWRAEHLRVVAFLQERASRRIVGAGGSTIN